jgi:hypothetical protein
MEMFEMLGLTPQNHLQKFLSLLQLTASSQFTTLGEKQNGQDQVTLLRKEPQLKKNNIFILKKVPFCKNRMGLFY